MRCSSNPGFQENLCPLDQGLLGPAGVALKNPSSLATVPSTNSESVGVWPGHLHSLESVPR